MGWGSRIRTLRRRRVAAALAAGVALAAAACGGGGGSGSPAPAGGEGQATGTTAPVAGAAPVDVPITGRDKLRVAGLPDGWATLGQVGATSTAMASSVLAVPGPDGKPTVPSGPAPPGVMMTTFMEGQPDDLVAATKAVITFTTFPTTAAGRAFVAHLLDQPVEPIGGRPVHVLGAPGGRPLVRNGVPYGAALFQSHGYYVVVSWSGVDSSVVAPALGQTGVVTG